MRIWVLEIVCFVRNILHDFANIAVQNPAEHLDGVRADALVSFQSRNLSGADAVFFNECILRNAALFHRFPELFIGDHARSHPLSLDMITKFGV